MIHPCFVCLNEFIFDNLKEIKDSAFDEVYVNVDEIWKIWKNKDIDCTHITSKNGATMKVVETPMEIFSKISKILLT
jgi:hypothetical protein